MGYRNPDSKTTPSNVDKFVHSIKPGHEKCTGILAINMKECCNFRSCLSKLFGGSEIEVSTSTKKGDGYLWVKRFS